MSNFEETFGSKISFIKTYVISNFFVKVWLFTSLYIKAIIIKCLSYKQTVKSSCYKWYLLMFAFHVFFAKNINHFSIKAGSNRLSDAIKAGGLGWLKFW